ncbi:unnamed protein product [Phyllotreta striolata]|uniref:acid phosphatase n=1 Tax=Phyllotreta striolata TaxID=444603 RepID=A0A9N9TT74_PHYSR|nr:unnamed protein product [Phyllotreta striolata]
MFKMYSGSVFVLLCFPVIISYVTCSDELIALIHVFRHGQRSPANSYKSDPYKNHWENLGPNQLTIEGRRQMYKLGQDTRTRYSDFIPKNYSVNIINIQSTDTDRTQMSAQCYLYGLFPASGDAVWLKNVDWQPISVHPVDNSIIYNDNTNCPTFAYLYSFVITNPRYSRVNQQYKAMYKYISDNTGESVSDMASAYSIHDILTTESQAGLELPEWTKKYFPEPLGTAAGYLLQSLTFTLDLKGLYIGPFLNTIVNYFDAMNVNGTSSPKIQAYSIHESNLGSILNVFGCFDPPHVPEFTSSIWIELKKNSTMDYVNVWYKNGANLTKLSVNGCDLNCPYAQFKQNIRDYIIDSDKWSEYCGYN